MTVTDLADLMALIKSLFPGQSWTEAEETVWLGELKAMHLDRAKEAVRRVYADSRYRTCRLSDIKSAAHRIRSSEARSDDCERTWHDSLRAAWGKVEARYRDMDNAEIEAVQIDWELAKACDVYGGPAPDDRCDPVESEKRRGRRQKWLDTDPYARWLRDRLAAVRGRQKAGAA